MSCFRKLVSVAVVGMPLIAGAHASAEPTNFGYSTLSVSANAVDYDDDVLVRRGGGSSEVVRYDGVSGATFTGSLQIEENLVLSISSGYQSDDGFGTEIEQSTGSLGLGFVTPLDDAMDFIAEFSFVSSEVEICNLTTCATVDDTGYGVAAGLRRWVSDSFELSGNISFVDVGDLGDSTSFGFGGAFWLGDHSSITASLSTSSDATGYSIGYRYTF